MLAAGTTFDDDFDLGSNLWPDVLKTACESMCLPTADIESHRAHLSGLVSRRNDIAHGRRHLVGTLRDFKPYEDAALSVMYSLACAILDAIESRSFLRS